MKNHHSIIPLVLLALFVPVHAALPPLFPGPVVPVAEEPVGLAVADFDEDGHEDLLVTGENAYSATLLLGTGDGTFRSSEIPLPDWSHRRPAVADFDEDGHLDFAAPYWRYATVLLGHGDGTFGAPVQYEVGSADFQAWTAIPADFNEDGHTDLMVGSYGSASPGSVAILLGNGDGTFASALSVPVSSGFPAAAASLDSRFDDHVDLVIGYADAVLLLLGNGDGTFTVNLHNQFAAGDDPLDVVAEDIDGDGDQDILVANSRSDDVSVLLGNGTRLFAPQVRYAAGDGPLNLAVRDVDGDGVRDVVVGNYQDFRVSVLLGQGNGVFAHGADAITAHSSGMIALGDFDENGETDLVSSSYWYDDLQVLLAHGEGIFPGQPSLHFPTGAETDSVAIADFDEDGFQDLAAGNSWRSELTVLFGTASGDFTNPLALTPGTNPGFVIAGDLDRNGHADLVSSNGGRGGRNRARHVEQRPGSSARAPLPLTGPASHPPRAIKAFNPVALGFPSRAPPVAPAKMGGRRAVEW